MTTESKADPAAVLLIEDDRGDALLLEALLEEAGGAGSLVWAASLAEALPHLARGPQCVLLDLGLPDATTTDLLETVIAAAPEAAVVVLTGLADEAGGIRAIARGAEDFIVKGSADGRMIARSIRYATERKGAANTARRLRDAELRSEENLRLELGLLPRPVLRSATVRCMTLYRPGGEQALLGGDFFDVVELADGTIRAMIGDVAGHGPDQAALGVRLRVAWRTLVLAGVPAASGLATLQDLLLSERSSAELFVTVCDTTVAPDRTAAQICLAGHPSPIVLSDDNVGPPLPVSGPPLGVLDGTGWRTSTVALGCRWALILYTDGLVENLAQSERHGRRLGPDGLFDVVRQCVERGETVQRIVQETLVALQDAKPGTVGDDVAIVAICPL